MLVGLDFDNTIVNYDRLFHRLACERNLIPSKLPAIKRAVRDFLRARGRENDWTELQGIAYGNRITEAEPFDGVKRFLARCCEERVRVAIVSHKTQWPYRGDSCDLHAAAHSFLQTHGFYETSVTGLSPNQAFLELTLSAKLSRIEALGCTAFVDDLPELLGDSAFPRRVRRVLFDPLRHYAEHTGYSRVDSWYACGDLLLTREEVCA